MAAGTRQLILDTAIRLFERDGYAATTMRAIATEAGVAPSNAYYWFSSKDELVQEFYRRIQAAHADRVGEVLAPGGSLAERLRVAEHAGLDVMAPYHSFGMAFLATAIRADSPTHPLHAASREAREMSTDIYRDVVAGARPAVPPAMRGMLPDLLWLCHLGVTLFWVSDSSAGQRRTRNLVDAAAPLVTGVVRTGRLPGAGTTVRSLEAVLDVVLDREHP